MQSKATWSDGLIFPETIHTPDRGHHRQTLRRTVSKAPSVGHCWVFFLTMQFILTDPFLGPHCLPRMLTLITVVWLYYMFTFNQDFQPGSISN